MNRATLDNEARATLSSAAAVASAIDGSWRSSDPRGDAQPRSDTRSQIARGLSMSVLSIAGQQALRLLSSLVLTRLLFPEAFGLMALVQVPITAIQMFSDFGLRASIVHHRRGDEMAFLDTAWAVQIVRGLVIWIAASASGVLFAWFYDKPELASLIPVAAVAGLISGFDSTARFTLIRHVRLGRATALELGSTFAGLLATAALAWAMRSVWALVLGSLVRALVYMTISHTLIRGYRNRWRWDRDAARAMLHLGKWMFVSTAVTFVITQGDKAALGKLLSSADLGVYATAAMLAASIDQLMRTASANVLFPMYARLSKDQPQDWRRKATRIRLSLLAVALPVVCLLAVFGDRLVELLYDTRYHEAGWMLQWLAAGFVGSVVCMTLERVPVAQGDSFRFMLIQVSGGVLLMTGMAAGWWIGGGLEGLIMGLGCGRFAQYLSVAAVVRRFNVWTPWIDLGAMALSVAAIAAGWRWC